MLKRPINLDDLCSANKAIAKAAQQVLAIALATPLRFESDSRKLKREVDWLLNKRGKRYGRFRYISNSNNMYGCDSVGDGSVD